MILSASFIVEVGAEVSRSLGRKDEKARKKARLFKQLSLASARLNRSHAGMGERYQTRHLATFLPKPMTEALFSVVTLPIDSRYQVEGLDLWEQCRATA